MIDRWTPGSTPTAESSADAHMAEAILVDLAPLVRRHPWWRARTRLVLTLLGRLGVTPPSRVVDVGTGWGTTLEALEARGFEAHGADVSPLALERLDRPGRRLVELDLAQPLHLPPDFEPFDAALALDVIEHIDDDGAALAQIARLVRPGGVVVVSVPALPDLWSEFDAIQGHRRRYCPETLRAAFAATGLTLDRTFFWGAWLVPPLRRSRLKPRAQPGDTPTQTYARYLRLPPWPAPTLLRIPFALEQRRALAGRLATGTSLFAVARKSSGPIVGQSNPVHRQRSLK